MNPDDPRHATWAGYNAGCREECCRAAARNYQKRRRHDSLHGQRRTHDIIGTRRRLRALMRIGWSAELIAQQAGVSMATIQALTSRATIKTVYAQTHTRIAKVYRELGRRPGPSKEATKHATRLGYASPAAWDEKTIDDPNAEPHGLGEDRHRAKTDVDQIAVLRTINGDRTLQLTKAERAEVCRQLRARGVSYLEIEKRYGLKADRYIEAAA